MLLPILSFRQQNKSTNSYKPLRPVPRRILESETAAWLVRANAYTQSALAELVRVRSIELANQSDQFKFSASHTLNLHNAARRSCSKEFNSRVLFSAPPEHGARWDRRHRNRSDRDQSSRLRSC